MTLVLDSGGVDALVRRRRRLAELRLRGMWPPEVSAVVLAETLTGDHRRDHATNRLLRICQIVDVDERTCREAARLRTATGRADTIGPVDAIVVAHAATRPDPHICTSDPGDIGRLVAQQTVHMEIITA